MQTGNWFHRGFGLVAVSINFGRGGAYADADTSSRWMRKTSNGRSERSALGCPAPCQTGVVQRLEMFQRHHLCLCPFCTANCVISDPVSLLSRPPTTRCPCGRVSAPISEVPAAWLQLPRQWLKRSPTAYRADQLGGAVHDQTSRRCRHAAVIPTMTSQLCNRRICGTRADTYTAEAVCICRDTYLHRVYVILRRHPIPSLPCSSVDVDVQEESSSEDANLPRYGHTASEGACCVSYSSQLP
jgi:hypothetical protein